MMNRKISGAILIVFLLGSLLPICWINMSLKTNEEIVGVLSLWPET
jgi:glycerol transport system permease protein